MIPEVGLHTFAAAHADGGHVIDVREPHEYGAGHVPRARLGGRAARGLPVVRGGQEDVA